MLMNADQYLFTILRRETVDTSVAQAVLNTLRPIIMPWANQYLAGIAPRVIAKPNVEEMVALIATAAQAERMTLDQYREDLAHREKVRACYAALEADCEACISLSAPAAAPLGLDSTGDPNCTVHASLLGVPAISLPVLQDDGLPLGLQTGFVNGDAQAFAVGAAIRPLF